MTREHICDTLHAIGDAIYPDKYKAVATPPIPIFRRILSSADVSNIVHEYDYKFYQKHDKRYTELTFESMQSFLEFDNVSDETYVAEYHDCDNFAIELAGHASEWAGNIPFGIVYLKTHAINCFISDGVLYFVEPQSDNVYTVLGENQEIHLIVL
jgi:hypothetical protein